MFARKMLLDIMKSVSFLRPIEMSVDSSCELVRNSQEIG